MPELAALPVSLQFSEQCALAHAEDCCRFPVTVTAEAKPKTNGDADPDLTNTHTSLGTGRGAGRRVDAQGGRRRQPLRHSAGDGDHPPKTELHQPCAAQPSMTGLRSCTGHYSSAFCGGKKHAAVKIWMGQSNRVRICSDQVELFQLGHPQL
jgi:hypothetical protein